MLYFGILDLNRATPPPPGGGGGVNGTVSKNKGWNIQIFPFKSSSSLLLTTWRFFRNSWFFVILPHTLFSIHPFPFTSPHKKKIFLRVQTFLTTCFICYFGHSAISKLLRLFLTTYLFPDMYVTLLVINMHAVTANFLVWFNGISTSWVI